MIGDTDLGMKRESQSTPWLTGIIWDTAARLGRKEFLADETPIEDDHIPFLEAGVPAVDLIDLEYEAWHTPQRHHGQAEREELPVGRRRAPRGAPRHRKAPQRAGSISFRISSSVSTDVAPLAWAKMRSTTSGSAARPRLSSQKTTFDLPDIGPISISWLRPTIAAGTPE